MAATPDGHKWTQTIFTAATFAVVAAGVIFGGGGFFSDTKGGLARLEDSQKQINSRLDSIQDRLEKGPRMDQLQDLYATNAKQDGRLDAMRDAYESRMRALELQVAEMRSDLRGITVSSGKKLPGDR